MDKITAEELAKLLDGHPHDHGFTKRIVNLAKYNNLVIVTAQGDDLVVFSGALIDEFDFLKGGDIYLVKEDNEYYPYLKPRPNAMLIQAFWEEYKLFKWKFFTKLPHAKFITKKNDKSFCQAIVFSLDYI